MGKDDGWLQERAENVLDEHDVVPVGSETEGQIVRKAVSYFEEGMRPFDASNAATAETRGLAILASDKDDEADPERVSLASSE